MPKPEPSPSQTPARLSRRRVRRRSRPMLMKRLARYTPLFELGARLGVNTFLAVAALLAMGRLVPYLQSQAAQLEEVNQALSSLEASTSKLKTDFGRYFDPWQAENIMQEQSGYRPPSERQVVWTADEEAEPKEGEPAETTGTTETTAEESPAAAEPSKPESPNPESTD